MAGQFSRRGEDLFMGIVIIIFLDMGAWREEEEFCSRKYGFSNFTYNYLNVVVGI